MRREPLEVVVLFLTMGLAVATASAQAQPATAPTTRPTTKPFEPFAVPSFSFTDQNGNTVTDEDLRGRVWVANFIFTRCTTACPIMSAKMVLLQRMVSDPQVRFVSFSVDPDYDTPQMLAEYADRWNQGERRWTLLSTDAEGLRETAIAMKILVRQTISSTDPIIHSTHFLLVDSDGTVRGTYNSGDDQALMRLAADIKDLSPATTGAPPAEPPVATQTPAADPVEAGKRLYNALGCAACHANARIGPHLTGLPGRDVILKDDSTVKADDAYLREAILDPGAKIVRGYGNTMPKFTGHITETEADQLVAYIKTLGQTGVTATIPPPAAAVDVAVDPVCEMKVTVVPDALKVDHTGTTYYFCSEMCVDRFKKNPAQYVGAR